MSIGVTVDLAIDPAKLDEFLAFIMEIAPQTRSYDGCQHFDIWVDQDEAGRVLFYELWDSREQYEKYVAWRAETGALDKLGPFVTAPPRFSYFVLHANIPAPAG